MSKTPTYETGIRQAPTGDHIDSVYRSAALDLTLIQFDKPAGSYPDPPSSEITIQFNNGPASFCEFDFGRQKFHTHMAFEEFVVTPFNTRCAFELHSATRPLIAALSIGLLARRLELRDENTLRDLGPLHTGMNRDHRVIEWMRTLWTAQSQDTASALFMDTGAIALTNRLLQLSGRMPARDDQAPMLAPCAAGRVFDYIEAHLADTLHLQTLARVACVSEYHFLRAFKAATGTSPHQYVLGRRLRLARPPGHDVQGTHRPHARRLSAGVRF